MKTCEDCGCRVYGGHCVNCHEETFIFEQSMENDEQINFSQGFMDKVIKQEYEASKEIKK